MWIDLTRKMVPITGRASSFVVFLKFKKNKKNKQQTNQFTQGYNILHRLQLHHLNLTFIIHNKYLYEYYYLYTYIYIYIWIVIINFINDMLFIKWYIQYKLLDTYKEEWEKQRITHDLYFF